MASGHTKIYYQSLIRIQSRGKFIHVHEELAVKPQCVVHALMYVCLYTVCWHHKRPRACPDTAQATTKWRLSGKTLKPVVTVRWYKICCKNQWNTDWG